MRIVLFLDALSLRDLKPWLKKHLITRWNPGVPKVTPNVISQIMTGNKPSDMNFIRSTPFRKPRSTHLTGETVLQYACKQGLNILQYGIPLCANMKLPDGSLSVYDHFLGQQMVPAALQFAKDHMSVLDEDPKMVLAAFIDQSLTQFSTLRTMIRNNQFDMIFMGYQYIDAYTHCWNPASKKRLIGYLEEELKDLNQYGEILYFSDHGNTAMKDIFYINKWLSRHGWLKYKVYYNLIEYNREGRDIKYPDTMTLISPFVVVDWAKTKFFCTDAFDAMLDETENTTEEDRKKLCGQLMKTGFFESVKTKYELFSRTDKCFYATPAIMPDSAKGIVVSCNVHKNAGPKGDCMENARKGWHDPNAVLGSTDKVMKNLGVKVTGPRNITQYLKTFIDLEVIAKEKRIEEAGLDIDTEPVIISENQQIHDNLRALGYI